MWKVYNTLPQQNVYHIIGNGTDEIELYFDIENAKLGALRRNLPDKLNGKKVNESYDNTRTVR